MNEIQRWEIAKSKIKVHESISTYNKVDVYDLENSKTPATIQWIVSVFGEAKLGTASNEYKYSHFTVWDHTKEDNGYIALVLGDNDIKNPTQGQMLKLYSIIKDN